jgi:tRNA1Val (adenine37-N6)-methyltransferase
MKKIPSILEAVSGDPGMSTDLFETRRQELEKELGEPITVDDLTSSLRIFQRRRGHRHSTDDLLTGFYALETALQLHDKIEHVLDLGAGIGTVGLLTLSGLSADACLTAIEAQDVSYRFLLENIRANALGSRVRAIRGDLRNLSEDRRYRLITGSPPYFPEASGIVPADSQKAHARFELRGDVRDYARTAAAHLSTDGLFVFCFPWPQKARAIDAVHGAKLAIVGARDVVPRVGLSPLFSLFACGHHPATTVLPSVVLPPLIVRDAEGRHTAEMTAVRARFGFPAEGLRPSRRR